MEMYATTVYVISDEVLRVLKVIDDPQSKMSFAEVITFAIVTTIFFRVITRWQEIYAKSSGCFPKS